MNPADPRSTTRHHPPGLNESLSLDAHQASDLLLTLQRSLPSGETCLSDDGHDLAWTPHQLPIHIHSELRTTSQGAMHIVDCTIDIARNVPSTRYLPLLSLYVRRLDPVGTLTLDSEGRLRSTARFAFLRDMTSSQRNQLVRDVLVLQAIEAELLIWQALLAGLLETQELTHQTDTQNGPWDRPDPLFAVTNALGRRGSTNIAHVLLAESSKLGPWFVGSEQDDMLKGRIRDGWLREPSRDGHAVRLTAPSHKSPDVAEVRINWAHHSPICGPTLQLTVVSRIPLGANPGETLRSLANLPDPAPIHARSGSWVPASWDDAAQVEGLAARVSQAARSPVHGVDLEQRIQQPFNSIQDHETAAYLLGIPTAFAVPGLLATVWSWAELHVELTSSLFRHGSRN